MKKKKIESGMVCLLLVIVLIGSLLATQIIQGERISRLYQVVDSLESNMDAYVSITGNLNTMLSLTDDKINRYISIWNKIQDSNANNSKRLDTIERTVIKKRGG